VEEAHAPEDPPNAQEHAGQVALAVRAIGGRVGLVRGLEALLDL